MGKRILIIDDEKDVLLLLEKRLAAEGYSVITANNGYDAVNLAQSELPDLIILDLAMPGMGGEVVAEKLKGNSLTRDIPIIFLTVLFPKRKGEEQGAVIAGHVFIAKPFDPVELLTEVEKLIQTSKETV